MPFDPHMHTDSEYRLLQNELQAANLTIADLRRQVVKLKDQLSRAQWQSDVLQQEASDRAQNERGSSGTFG